MVFFLSCLFYDRGEVNPAALFLGGAELVFLGDRRCPVLSFLSLRGLEPNGRVRSVDRSRDGQTCVFVLKQRYIDILNVLDDFVVTQQAVYEGAGVTFMHACECKCSIERRSVARGGGEKSGYSRRVLLYRLHALLLSRVSSIAVVA